MIDIKDLCIGNKVMCTISNDAGIYTVTSIPNWEFVEGDLQFRNHPIVVIDRCPREVIGINKIKGIQITEQILQDWCGFAKAPESDRYGGWLSPIMNEHFKTKMRVFFIQGICTYVSSGNGTIELKWLHKLQNMCRLFFYYDLKIQHSFIKSL